MFYSLFGVRIRDMRNCLPRKFYIGNDEMLYSSNIGIEEHSNASLKEDKQIKGIYKTFVVTKIY